MTTPRDLLLVAMDMPSDRLVDRGDLSLALAAAELIDLLAAKAVTLVDGHIVPQPHERNTDRLLDEAMAAVLTPAPHETVDDWLWRRGRGLPAVYLAVLEEEGPLVRETYRRWGLLPGSRLVLADTAGRRRAAQRWSSDEPLLVALAAAVGLGEEGTPPDHETPGGAVGVVLESLTHAVEELAEERRLRASALDRANATYRSRGY